jgi:hypothetical protein
MWVLILFYLSSASASVAMHDFASQAACEHARAPCSAGITIVEIGVEKNL